MTDREIHQLIEEEHAEQKARIYERIHEDAERIITQNAQQRQRRKRLIIKYCSVAAVLLVVLCLSVILPIVLNTNGNNGGVLKYDNTQIVYSISAENIKEYANKNNVNILFVDWYDNADGCETIKYCDAEDESVLVYISERLVNGDTGKAVLLSVMQNKIVVTTFDSYEEAKESYNLYNGTAVYYIVSFSGIKAHFEYNGYKYYLEFTNSTDLEFVKETIESMFNN